MFFILCSVFLAEYLCKLSTLSLLNSYNHVFKSPIENVVNLVNRNSLNIKEEII